MHGRLPVTDIILTSDVEVVAITISQRCAIGSLDSFLNVLGLVRDSRRASIPEDRIAVKAAEVVGGVSPGDINRIITRPHARGMAGAADPGWVSGCGGIDEERPQMDGRLPVTGIVNATDVEVVAIAVGQLRTGDVASPSLNVLSRIRGGIGVGIPED